LVLKQKFAAIALNVKSYFDAYVQKLNIRHVTKIKHYAYSGLAET